MKNEDIKTLALSLAKAETETDVVRILEQHSLWSDESLWKNLDNNDGNWSVGGNQQSGADAALVEKIINSVDAVLIRECLREGIVPDSAEAPKNIAEAQKKYFGVHDGKLSSVDAKFRARLAENICLVATGEKSKPSYSIIDLGEGQSPDRFPTTFLSLTKSNKARVQFVQGKFGMGGTGIFRFGSPNHNLQLIISRRDPKIKIGTTDAHWGVTVIKRVPPTGSMRSSVLRYLAPNDKILAFTAESLPLLPGEYPAMYESPLEHGTFIKIYEYDLTGLKTNVKFDLYYRLSLLMPNIALPITLYERRKGYKGQSHHIVLSGLSVRLDEDKRDNLEENFPSSGELNVQGQKMDFLIYAFQKGQREKYAKSEGVIFTVNGQVHGSLTKSFFERKAVGMSYLSDSILVLVDCTKLDRGMQEKLFMNSRDRLVEGPLKSEIENQLEDVLKNHPGLKALREKRRREDIENKLQDSKPLADVLENIIKKSPSLSSLFMQGVRIKNPFNLTGVTEHGEFQGKTFPTYFTLAKEYPKEKAKNCPLNRKFRMQYETDANNDYFNRDKEPGELSLKINGVPIEDYTLNLWNGLATLTISLPSNANVGDVLCFQTEVIDHTRAEAISSEFCIQITAQEDKSKGVNGNRKKPSHKDSGNDRQKPSYLDIPNAIEVRKEEWEKHGFDEKSALKVIDAGEDAGYDFFINMDNVYMQMEVKENSKIDPRLLEARFKYGMVLLGISLLDFEERRKKEKGGADDNISIYDRIESFSKAVSPTLLPMIAALGTLEIET
ncbi:MAG: hypothetical protein WD605_02175 [Candidatus Paceibacterota bacterium]